MVEFNEEKLTTICSEIWYRAISADDGAEVIWDEFAEVQRENAALKERLVKLEGTPEGCCEWAFRNYDADGTGWYGTGCGCLERSTTGRFCQCCGRKIVIKETP